MQVLLNIIILSALVLLLSVEQRRYSTLVRRVDAKRKELLVLSHELRSPFIALKKYNSFLLKKEFGQLSLSQIEVLNRMEQASSDVLVILNRILAASRLENGEIRSNTEPVDIRDSIHAAVDALGGLIQSRGHTVVLKLPSRRIVSHTDPLLLHGVLDELIQNAAAYTPAKGTITITLRQSSKDCTVDIADTGIGINADESTKIFSKFYRGTRALEMHEGHGLGLWFARQFAKRIKGTVTLVRSSPKESVFRLTLSGKIARRT